ncbi:MAG: MBOAT family protein [Pseudomonadales bacterium]|nr:MBOAT family protein [Pseudomonadales bacterium]
MLFNSFTFIFAYLPVVVVIFFILGKYRHHLALIWLLAASLFFYGWWNPAYIPLLLASIFFNYSIGRYLISQHGQQRPRQRHWTFILGITGNLGLLAYYKYGNFLVININNLMGTSWPLPNIVLPLGISFFTFTQIAFLVDAYRHEVREANIIHYGLFVTYFPHLIAGPILHHKEMMPQFSKKETFSINWENWATGLTLFTLGLFKKVVIADSISPFVNTIFSAASQQSHLHAADAWGGALAYTFQLYFDFSGYTDMALGISRILGIELPLNFNSPYKSFNIIDFWRRWHMTLSRFLRDYLYISLGGNRHGTLRRYVNLLLTMLLGGLWHGAGWTFVIWGALHGIYLMINHGWRHLWMKYSGVPAARWLNLAGGLLTFTAVVIAWVFFRADNIPSALVLVSSMVHPDASSPEVLFPLRSPVWRWILCLMCISFWAPNSQEILNPHQSPGILRWQPNLTWLILTILVLLYSLTHMELVSEFLYFQF